MTEVKPKLPQVVRGGVVYVGEGIKFERVRRITGYLVGTLDRFNNAKRAEEADRVKHGYGINRRGEVKSPTGVILTVTERGQVRVKKDGKVRLEYIGDLLADAGQADAMLAREKYEAELLELRKAVAKAECDLGEKAERLRLARKLNALLLAKVRRG